MTISFGLEWLHMQKDTFRSTTSISPLKQSNRGPPMENIVATHPLELVYIDYLCLEPGKGKEEKSG